MDKLVIDLDSGVTNIYRLGSGVVLSEPTVIAVSSDGKNTIKAV
jgi:actin-like ATPase involved in cell morphogenesis